MKEFRLRNDLDRAVIDGFALPLGFEPGGVVVAPVQGYTLTFNTGEGDDPDTYTFQIVTSHERLSELIRRCFDMLPNRVFPIVEIGSRDAYRALDVYLAEEAMPTDEFRAAWSNYEPFLLEDGSVGAGVNAETPFFEVFIDQRKTVVVHAPLGMQEVIETMLHQLDLEEVQETWSEESDSTPDGPPLRPILDLSDDFCPDVDELLLYLRHEWRLQLNIDPETNIDDGGRELGLTLWHVVVIVFGTDPDDESGAYMSVWLTAASLNDTEAMLRDELAKHPQWSAADIYAIDRVAYDERPDELGDLPPKPVRPGVHLVNVDPWAAISDRVSDDPADSGDDDLTDTDD